MEDVEQVMRLLEIVGKGLKGLVLFRFYTGLNTFLQIISIDAAGDEINGVPGIVLVPGNHILAIDVEAGNREGNGEKDDENHRPSRDCLPISPIHNFMKLRHIYSFFSACAPIQISQMFCRPASLT